MSLAELDHLAVSASTLEAGRAYVEASLGVRLSPGGKHPAMGTHNLLLGLDDGLYLEVIAIDPEATAPDRPRWFGLDRFAGPARLQAWICRTDDLDKALELSPAGAGTPMELERGDLRWRMAVPGSGVLPFDNLFPALIEWHGTAHPAKRLPRSGCRLRRLTISTSQPDELRFALAPLLDDPRVEVVQDASPGLSATIETPAGLRRL